jgi:DNA-binding MarR family transcriptional regulator
MSPEWTAAPEECTCLAVRQAARRVTQFYDQHLAPSGIRTTQFSILAKLRRLGETSINELAAEMVMDRTTLGRNVLPLEREGLISIEPGRTDRRSKTVKLTAVGRKRLDEARERWRAAQNGFARAFGEERTVHLRSLLREATATELPEASIPNP